MGCDCEGCVHANNVALREAEARVLAAAEDAYDEYDGPHETALTLAVIHLRKVRAHVG